MQQVTNYGSFLQAFALKKLIENLGHSVEFINICSGRQLPEYRISKFHRIKLLLKRLAVKHPIAQLKTIYRLHSRFDNEFKPELGVTQANDNYYYNTIVIGSDEVFNVAQETWFGFSPQLFGANLNADRVISYAACFGATTFEKLASLGIVTEVKNALSNLSIISIRDKNSKTTIEKLGLSSPVMNVDPVIAYEFMKEIKLPDIKIEYLLIYTYPGRMNNKEEITAIRNFARDKNLKIISVANYFDWVDEVVTPHPFEVLGYFKSAKYVVTDTFHGAVMSMKYNKQFAVIVREMNNNKLSYLLEQFYLSERIIHNINTLSNIITKTIDYFPVNEKIVKERQLTVSYLQENI